MQLAKTERDLQSLKIQQDLHNDKMEAVVASRISGKINFSKFVILLKI